MAQDPIANYVVKKAIETAPEGEPKQKLLTILSVNRDELASAHVVIIFDWTIMIGHG